MPNFYHPYSDAFLADPWPVFRRMRDEAPAYFVEDLNTWALSRFEDVWQAGQDKKHYTANHGTTLDALVGGWTTPAAFVFMDPPEHTLYRGLVAPLYQKGSVDALEQKLRAVTRKLLAPALQAGELEIYQLATAVGLHTIADFIGVDYADLAHARRLLDIFFRREPGIQGTTPQGNQALGELQAFIMQLVHGFRVKAPAKNTHADAWLNAMINGKQMTDEQIFFTMFSLTVTGSDTLALACAGTIFNLSQHPEQFAAVRADHSLVPHAFAETVRYDQPTNILGRRVVQDLELHGETLRAGQNVVWLFASANRDEREFPDADQYQISRRPRRNLSFGTGLHACLGIHLARLEGKIILEELLAAIPEYEVQTPRCTRVYGEFLQGYNHVPITFRPQ